MESEQTMNTIKFVNETGSIMFLDGENNLINNIFINQYYYTLINDKQKEALRIALSKENREFQELYLYNDNTLILNYRNTSNGIAQTAIIYATGETVTHRTIDILDITDNGELNLLHDFLEATFNNYVSTLKKVESETNKEFEVEAYTYNYFMDSLNEYQKQYNDESTDLNYLEWLEAEITNYILF